MRPLGSILSEEGKRKRERRETGRKGRKGRKEVRMIGREKEVSGHLQYNLGRFLR
jgi:hypothetical protein